MVVVAVILVFVPKGGGDSEGPFKHDPETPPFEFVPAKVLSVPTNPDADEAALQTRAEAPAAEVTKAMDALYISAFLDPANWQDGTYDDVWALFDPGSGTEAQAQIEVVTAGTGAGAAFDSIVPIGDSTLSTKVLFDPADEPYSVIAIVRFKARGSGIDGQDVEIMSSGQYVFQRVEGSWMVVSFKVLRDDEMRVRRSPSPSGSSV